MPLSKARDGERRRQSRLESNNVQLRYIVRPEIVMPEPDYVSSVTITNATDIEYIDADGNPIYED